MSIQAIKAAGCQPGLVFNPALPLDVLDWVIEDIDLIDHVDWPRFVARYRIGVEPDPGPVGPDDEAS